MATITISQTEYDELVDTRLRYEYLREVMEGNIFSSPPAKHSREVIKAFRAEGRYSEDFLKSLEEGLKRSSHFES